MFRKSDLKARASMLTPVIALLAMLAQAAAAYAQTGLNEQVRVLWPPPFIAAPPLDTNATASTGPALLALADVACAGTAAGGLWLSGDIAEGFRYLQWIADNQSAELLKIDSRGKVSFNLRTLAKAAGITSENTADQSLRIASFLRSDEGLYLLAEVMNGSYRYLLHVGKVAPTLAGNVRLNSVANYDNRFDSRITPRRANKQKTERERPPERFDSLIAINPDARLFNLYDSRMMPVPQLAFHELAEAHARLVLNLDYLPQCDKPGAHDVAIEREIRLRQDRPGQLVVMPIGLNIVLVSRDEWLQVFAKLRDREGARSLRAYSEIVP